MASMQDEAQYLAAIERCATQLVEMHLNVGEVVCIVAVMQLALRHPEFPLATRQVIEGLLARWIAAMMQYEPTIAALMRAGNDRQQDIAV